MAIVKIWLIIMLATLASWYVLKLVNNPKPLAWIFMFWLAVIGTTTVLLYLVSVYLVA
ncbi:hypothetical protein JX580_08880 [Thiomicrospira microaerophila]|uniref:hypothetical protein n=1 Tax=Thiomicrospira microaerophila TaxID=406020 RepID=UPI00200CAE6B|nr:hypothetical protein [Thiomicrospira microaerophila]UQB41777.1 hypothetical protein JX580_08880 [Thiomicrospira microaerophila]